MKSLVQKATGRMEPPTDEICVSPKVRKRVRHLLELDQLTVIDQALNSIWTNISAHRRGGPRLDDAILSAEVLLAMLVEIKRREG